MHSKTKGSIIVYMDDDDYYPPDRISHAVEKLLDNKQALCAGSSEIYIYFKHISKMIQFGPYGPSHATAGTFAFRSELLKITRYQDHAAVAEEREFLKGYTIPFVQLDPMKTILCFSHEQNTFDKRRLLENPHPDYVKESKKKVSDFIKLEKESEITKFFMEDIDPLLKKYEPGEPKMKPDVLKQIAEIEKEREKMAQDEMAKNGQIMINRPGQPPTPLSPQQIVEMLSKQGEQIQTYEKRILELEIINKSLQKRLIEKAAPNEKAALSEKAAPNETAIKKPTSIFEFQNAAPVVPNSKSEPLFKLDASIR
jgi:hypothetical protein